jgi:hypothetical protein
MFFAFNIVFISKKPLLLTNPFAEKALEAKKKTIPKFFRTKKEGFAV